MKMGTVQEKPISFFRRNEKNGEFFEEKNLDLSSMIEDIKKRGVLVPLVAKEDGTLLAGHCRFKAAKSAGLKFLPVQVVTDITADEEFEYLIKDNAVRRHFSCEDRLKIYRRIYPEFDADVLILRKISIQHIVDISGLNYNTVNADLIRIRDRVTDIRKKRTKEENLLVLYRRLTTQILNAVIAGNIKKEDAKSVTDVLRRTLDESVPVAVLPVAPKEKMLIQRRIL